ncbi:hypothetical protein AGDE_10066 [Angomonas deanei]|nr:hypothetical protein AGDE_10066 [Angomonas deanei]|eukprot:EPY29218.1 hypothetical protein AGDE_10066 [Angomonas deanei]
MSFRLKNANGRQLVGPLVEVSIRDLDELDNPNVIISLMHSIHVCGTHAPNSVWGSLFHRLVKLNDTRTSLSSTGGLEHKGESEKAEKPLSKRALKRKQGEQVGHVFSGLTTREIFRTVDVLRQERWNGGGLPMQTLIDAALKNIAFELDALKADEDTADLSYRGVLDRLSLVADLKWRELLSLLLVAGDVDIPFDSTTDKIVDRLLLPMVKHLHGADLLELLRVIRRLKCNAPNLITILSQKLRYEGPHAQYALPLTLSVVKTLVKSNTLIAQVEAEPILHYYFAICQLYHNKVRVKGLLEMAEMTYAISRHSTLPSEIYQKCQSVTELLCTQMELLLQLEVVDAEAASKLLEYTIVLNMRDEKKFPCTANLLTCRNVALERSAKQEEETEEGNTSETRFPRVPRAAVDVCNELAYVNERIVIVRADMVEDERIRFYHTVSNAGLFSLFLGLKLFQHGYLHDTERNLPLEAELNALLQHMSEYAPSPSSVPRLYTMQNFPNTIPSWAEQTLWRIVQHKLKDFRISSSSSDEDVLRCFGDLKCDERKVEQFFHNMMTGPILFIKSRKELWDFNAELARRFGDAKSVETANTRSKTSLY